MKKAEQEFINARARRIFDSAIDEYNAESEYVCKAWRQLRSCTAWVAETDNYYLLRSYDTIIACIEKSSDTLVDVLRVVYGYTATSAHHISKFGKDFGAGKWGCENRIVAR